jgi:hypothetical protein
MIPEERTLVQRLEQEPFALVGINTDSDLDVLKRELEKHKVTWRNAWEGPNRAGRGKISQAWGVNAFPSLFVIDARGVIRAKDPSSLARAIDPLVAEAKSAAANR